MKNFFFILLLICAIQLNANDALSIHNQVNMSANTPKLVEVVLTLSFEDLIIHQDGISVNYEGNLFIVHSLEKSGAQWLVRAGKYCPNNHRVVCGCGGCAISSCGYCCSCFSDYNKSS